MTIRYKCRNCGAILYEHNKSDHCGLLTPREVALIHGCICPVCKAQLNPDTNNPDWREHIIIKQAEHSKRGKRRSSIKPHIEARSEEVKGVRFISGSEFIIEEL
jgi:RNA polymerase subunit RPABC4/transcription elongation factor Spt4